MTQSYTDVPAPPKPRNPYILEHSNEKMQRLSPKVLIIVHQALVAAHALLGLVAGARRYVRSNFYVGDVSHFLFTTGFYITALINTFGMAYNRQSFGIFFQRYWHGVSALFMTLLNLPVFTIRKAPIAGLQSMTVAPTRDTALDWLCIAVAASGVVVFITSMFTVVRAENYRRDGGPFDYIGEYIGGY